MSEIFQPNHLLDTELNYELAIRAVNSTRPVADRRKILRRLLGKEQTGGKTEIVDELVKGLDFKTEAVEIEATMQSIKGIIADFEGNETDSTFLRMKSRLIHLLGRIKRLPYPENSEDAKSFQKEAHASCLLLEADLYDCVTKDNLNLANNFAPPAPIIHVAPPVVSCSGNVLKISDWSITFNGNPKDLYDFLERITELAESRKVKQEDLFNSASELFVGDAFVWYRSVKSSVDNWDSLVCRLKRDFLHFDVEDDLWNQIKHRKQKRNESVAVFIAHLEVLFARLVHPPAEITKIKHIRQNLLPDYITQLALADIPSVQDLVNLCRKLEEASYIRNKNHTVTELSNLNISDSSSKNKFHSNSNFNKNKFSNNHFKNKNNSSNANIVNEKSPLNSGSKLNATSNNSSKVQSNSKSNIVCWNCSMPNHTYQSCRLKRKLFCFKCGLLDVKINNCPNCSKNL